MKKCKLVIFSDIHYAPEKPVNNGSIIDRKLMHQAVPLLEQLIQKINNEIKPNMVVNLGDLVEDFNDHEINLEIGKQEGLNEKEIEILDGKRSRKNEETLKSNSYERKICAYCDQRVSPNGVVSIKERLEDAKVRYKDKPLSVWSNKEKADYLIECSLGIEKQIMEYCTIMPEDINDVAIEKYIEELREYEMKK